MITSLLHVTIAGFWRLAERQSHLDAGFGSAGGRATA
jgi:hypothetical protein